MTVSVDTLVYSVAFALWVGIMFAVWAMGGGAHGGCNVRPMPKNAPRPKPPSGQKPGGRDAR